MTCNILRSWIAAGLGALCLLSGCTAINGGSWYTEPINCAYLGGLLGGGAGVLADDGETALAGVVGGAAVGALLCYALAAEDSDRDGVRDVADRCPRTSTELTVDALGCPADADRDGVADAGDLCAGTPAGIQVDARGCALDLDRDGVVDFQDRCPDTPLGLDVSEVGCALGWPSFRGTL